MSEDEKGATERQMLIEWVVFSVLEGWNLPPKTVASFSMGIENGKEVLAHLRIS